MRVNWVGGCVWGIMIESAVASHHPTIGLLRVEQLGNVVIDAFGAVVSVFERKLCRNIA